MKTETIKREFKKNDPRILNAWASYDWANSVYNLAITVAIFPAYYEAVVKTAYNGNEERTLVDFFGLEFESGVFLCHFFFFSNSRIPFSIAVRDCRLWRKEKTPDEVFYLYGGFCLYKFVFLHR